MKIELNNKTITPHDVRKIRGLLKEVIRAASLEGASFNVMDTGTEQTITLNLQKDITAFVRGQIQPHHSAWVLWPLKNLLNQLERFES